MRSIYLLMLSLTIGFYYLTSSSKFGHSNASGLGDVTEQINKTITLAPDSNVKVSGINGPLTIETWDGNRAEINIAIRASDREALERHPLLVEETPNSLTIRTENDREGRRGGDRGWVHHEARLKLPRRVNLRVSGVNGAVDIGQIGGEIAVSGINGRVEVAQAGTATEISGINGATAVSLVRLGDGGLRVSGINGRVEIGLPATTNANVNVHGVNGGIDTDLPITVVGEMKKGNLTGTIGSGGSRIEISGINGGVLLKRI